MRETEKLYLKRQGNNRIIFNEIQPGLGILYIVIIN